jgi:PAS domain S-box-containing protein
MKFRFQEKPLFYIILFILLVIVISIAGVVFFTYSFQQEKNKAYSNLSTLARLKVNQISKWREDRLSEAEFIQSNLQFKRLVSGHLKYPQFNTIKKDIIEWLRLIKENHEYTNIIIIDTLGGINSLFKEKDSLNKQDQILYNLSIKNKEIILSGFYNKANEITMGSFIPLSLPEMNEGRIFAVLELRIDPRINLYPLIELSPITSKTAESFIVKEEGDSVVFLSDLKFKENAAASFKLPLSMTDLPASMAIKGIRGVYEGVDYDGEKVLADISNIPNSPWYIISDIYLDEVYEPVRRQAFYILVGVLTLILLSGSIVYIAWKNEKIEAVKKQLHFEREKKDLFKNMSEGYAYCQMFFENGVPSDFQFIEVNDAFTELTGLKNVLGKRISEFNPKVKDKYPQLFEVCGRVVSTEVPEKFETYRAAIGKWISVSVYSPRKGYFVAIINDITAQKNYVIELKKLSSAVEQSPASVVITDLNGNIEYVNPKFTEVTGFTYEEIIGKNPHILKSGKTPKHVYTKLWNAITQGHEWQGELLNKKKNGELFWEYASISPIKNESGTITHYVAVKEDITKKKQIEKELQESEERFRKMFEDHKAIMLLIEPGTGSIIDANPAAVQFYGYNKKSLCSQKIQDIIQLPPEEIEIERWEGINKSQAHFIFPHKLSNGEVRIVEVYSSPLEIKKKPLLFHIIHDITERRHAEEALRESEERFRNLADSMPQIVWTANPDGTVDYYNNRVAELEGITQNNDGTWKWVPVLHEDDVQPTIDAWHDSYCSGKYYEITHRVKTKDGKYKWLLSRAYPIKNTDGNIIKWYGTATDINEQKETEQALELALLELKRSNKELEQFAYSASHDLQEPIRMIRSYAQLLELKNKTILGKGSRDYLKYIAEGASRMQQLINDLLMYSRVSTTGKKFEDVDCNLILKDVLEDLKFQIQEENAVIEAGIMPVVKGDRTQLRQLFQNLIQNAVKFRCEKNPEIKIRSERKDNKWLFSISDNGIGIDPRFHERIFVIFQRMHTREKYTGTGVGLAICKKIIERHGGQIYVESELNKGTTFYFTIPA